MCPSLIYGHLGTCTTLAWTRNTHTYILGFCIYLVEPRYAHNIGMDKRQEANIRYASEEMKIGKA